LGRYKVASNSVIERNALTGQERTVLETSDPGVLTETAMADLLAWYNDTLPSSPWTLAVASEFVFRFLACHPFQDGNGRIGRGLFLLCLLQSPEPHFNQLAPYLAIDRVIEQRRQEYYVALARTGTAFSADPSAYRLDVFVRFMLKVTAAAIDSIELTLQRQISLRALPQQALTVLACFKDQPESRLTPKRIQEATALPVRTVTRSLKRLVDIGLLQRYGKGPGTRYQLIF
jgi:Fic family protein